LKVGVIPLLSIKVYHKIYTLFNVSLLIFVGILFLTWIRKHVWVDNMSFILDR